MARRKQQIIEYTADTLMFAGFSVIALFFPLGWAFTLFVIFSIGALILLRRWALGRYGHDNATLWARYLVSRQLDGVLWALREDPGLGSSLGVSQENQERLTSADEDQRRRLQRRILHRPPPGRALPPSWATKLVSVMGLIAGAVVGTYIQYAVGDAVRPLCDLSGWGFLRALSLTVEARIAIGIFVVAWIGARLWYALVLSNVRKRFTFNPVGHLRAVTAADPAYAPALRNEVDGMAASAKLDEKDYAILVPGYAARSREPNKVWWAYSLLNLARVNEIVLPQMLTIVGVVLGVALPPLLGFTCPPT